MRRGRERVGVRMSDTLDPKALCVETRPTGTHRRTSKAVHALILVVVGLVCYLPGIQWGLPAVESWSQDSISGMRTLGAVSEWPGAWRGRYPPLHYFILRAAYEPALRLWEASGELKYDADGRLALAPPHGPKLGRLHFTANIVSVGMGIGAGLLLYWAALILTNNGGGALLAAVAFMNTAEWSYFAKLGNVDVPSVFWFMASVCFYVRALQGGGWIDCALLGLFGSFAISTKDSVAGLYPGMAVVLWLAELGRRRDSAAIGRAAWRATTQWKWLLGAACFIAPYLVLNGLFAGTDSYLQRMRYWLDLSQATRHAQQHRYEASVELALATIRYAASAVGWPMVVALFVAVMSSVRERRLLLTICLPIAGYYLLVIERMDFVYARFLFPCLALLCIPLGKVLSELVASRRWITLAAGLTAIVAVPTWMYTFAINMEMTSDTRYRAEAWFRDHVPPPSSIGASSKPQYLPRLAEAGYATYGVEMNVAGFDRPQPEFLVLTSFDTEDYDDSQRACAARLLDGTLGYRVVQTFAGRYLGASRSWWSVAGWGAPPPGKISPSLTILQRP